MVFVEKRNVAFNSLLGTASINVPVYSNGDDSFFSGKSNFLYGVYTGVKWQCVEYARRWLFIRKGCTFADVYSANDMWYKLSYVEQVVDGKRFPLKTYPNGSPTKPKTESLIIYERNSKLPFGHVAVIVDVVPGYIRVAEQNYYYYYWSNSYARQIPLAYKNGRYYIEDHDRIYGWMEVQDNNHQLKPLDAATIKIIAARNGVSV
ncbi:unnamed protein product [Rotaria socialis]|uniref:Peptidase C51 domain-containing protein n=1 Tax=Rotaria socialis TaxID=392032 RepID=A0A821PV70_9BILA|nr:unnamed protein product [Rotaria socialis]CAF3631997.1 unnamed protein product [Rotaria socialis]CAF4814063.1 unnamed protein product [Rotaria socialis]CAF4893736.1 unnamed protein product [Rotaria socialis]